MSVIYKVSGSELEMITAGVLPPNPAELLGNEKFQTLIKTARANYDYVMIDSPPLGRVIDAAIIAKQCDASVFGSSSACGSVIRMWAKSEHNWKRQAVRFWEWF